MKSELEYIINLIEPEYTNTVESLKSEDKNDFVYQMVLSLKRGLYEWDKIKNDRKHILYYKR